VFPSLILILNLGSSDNNHLSYINPIIIYKDVIVHVLGVLLNETLGSFLAPRA